MVPTIGQIVDYMLTAEDAAQINRRRTTGKSIADRLSHHAVLAPDGTKVLAWPVGAQAHIGNEANEGNVYPMLIVRRWGTTEESAVNGQVFLDGNDSLWVTSVTVGEGPRHFQWPNLSAHAAAVGAEIAKS